jgi:hypothetical protein
MCAKEKSTKEEIADIVDPRIPKLVEAFFEINKRK